MIAKIIGAVWSRAMCLYCQRWYDTDAEAAACTQRCYQERYGK